VSLCVCVCVCAACWRVAGLAPPAEGGRGWRVAGWRGKVCQRRPASLPTPASGRRDTAATDGYSQGHKGSSHHHHAAIKMVSVIDERIQIDLQCIH
jgi:hypothetical protein